MLYIKHKLNVYNQVSALITKHGIAPLHNLLNSRYDSQKICRSTTWSQVSVVSFIELIELT